MKLNQIPEVMLEKHKDIAGFTPITQHGRRCYNQGLKAQGEVEVELDRDKVVNTILKWAKEQEAIDKFGEITLGCEGQDIKDVAQALSDNLPKVLRRKQ